MTARVAVFDPLLAPDEAKRIVERCASFGPHGMYSEEGLNEGIGEGLPQRFDAALNYVRSGGRKGRTDESPATLAARTNYFRETYAYGDEVFLPGIEPFQRHEGFVEAARALFGRPVVEPAIVYANLMVPGQELAVHTDVPEFRGANRKRLPQWLLVVMHHSGLFDAWRMPIATGISWYHDAAGGELAYYPDGPDAPPAVHAVHFNTALLLDTDSVFHGVDRIRPSDDSLPPLRPGMKLTPDGDGRWSVRDPGGEAVAAYDWSELRFSISWKAYCFADAAEQRAWRQHSDDLTPERILADLEADLRGRGALEGPRPPAKQLAQLLVRTYIRFPGALS